MLLIIWNSTMLGVHVALSISLSFPARYISLASAGMFLGLLVNSIIIEAKKK